MRNLSKIGKKINSKTGKAIGDYNLIETGDRILVAVSGGKDSLSLLRILSELKKWAPVQFDLFAGHIATDFDPSNDTLDGDLIEFFEKLEVNYHFGRIDVLDDQSKTNCFWCSWNKRKKLFKMADDLGCNKIAFGHHKDDIAETILMNLFYNGQISAMNPRQELFQGRLTLIRPFCYVEEELLNAFAEENDFGRRVCECAFAEFSKRAYIKELIRQFQSDNPRFNIKTNICKSISRVKDGYIDLKEESL
ncbi:MAG: ATP-binding protein [Candidatus Omnitrophica bacterium]|nr:ATP-binding protein [Candidatus Omnitrophota bacterium]